MTLHIFNPEHDLALASNLTNFTAPHAARNLRAGLGYLPALWAGRGDYILVEDADYAEKAYKRLLGKDRRHPGEVVFIEAAALDSIPINNIEPWGWDPTLRNFLIRHGVDSRLMPTLEEIDTIRTLSHRSLAKELLDDLRKIPGTTGNAHICQTTEEIEAWISQYGQVVVKAPWSSSGRGIRFISTMEDAHIQGWIKNMLKAQGCLLVEPYLKKVKDFGIEFFSDGEGGIQYCGLSLFNTVNGAYSGNILATEKAKYEMFRHYDEEWMTGQIRAVVSRVQNFLGPRLKHAYRGPFGIDLMLVTSDERQGFLLDPCVEINLRRTMGHVALSLAPDDDDIKRVMRITTNDNYQLKIRPL